MIYLKKITAEQAVPKDNESQNYAGEGDPVSEFDSIVLYAHSDSVSEVLR